MWQNFVALSEEQQQCILSGKRKDQKKAVSGTRKPKASALKSLESIDRNIRAVLHNRRAPHVSVDIDVVICFFFLAYGIFVCDTTPLDWNVEI